MRITSTDAYKFSMAEAGFALRTETFYYSHRRGGFNGWHYLPFDVETFVKEHLPVPSKIDYDYMSQHNYEVGASYRRAFTLLDQVKVVGIPKNTWFFNREPVFSVTGPSAVVSWLEPTVLQLQFGIQIATDIMSGKELKVSSATCQDEKDLILKVCDALNHKAPAIIVREDQYFHSVLKRAQDLVRLVKNPDRIFEVGMRAVSCEAQHEIPLQAVKEAGIKRTSNVRLAQILDMVPVGTMGHEHVQRYGDDYEAFTAMRDRFPGFLFYLPDTFNTLRSGIPSALRVIAEQPERDAGIRFDSEHGIRGHYSFTVARAREMGLEPRLALESGWNYELTEEFEKLREMVRWPEDRQAYGFGGYLVKPEWPTYLRDDVSAVWKISQSGSRAVMKFGDEPNSGKASIPGKPVVWRINPLYAGSMSSDIIAQEGENVGYLSEARLLSGAVENGYLQPNIFGKEEVSTPTLSPATQVLIRECEMKRDEALVRASERGL